MCSQPVWVLKMKAHMEAVKSTSYKKGYEHHLVVTWTNLHLFMGHLHTFHLNCIQAKTEPNIYI